MTPEERLASQVERAQTPIYLETKSEIVEYYRDHHRAGQSWRQAIVHDLATMTGKKTHSLERRFDPSRLNRVPRTGKDKEEYRQLGRQLPAQSFMPPAGGYNVTFRGLIRISQKCYLRSFERVVPPNVEGGLTFEDIFFEYFEEDLAEGYCEEPQVIVSPA